MDLVKIKPSLGTAQCGGPQPLLQPTALEISNGLRLPSNSRAEAINQTFLGIMVRGLGQLLAYFYSQQRCFYPELLRDDTFRLKQKEAHHRTALTVKKEKQKSFWSNHVCQNHLYFEPLFQLTFSFSLCMLTLPSYDIKRYTIDIYTWY